MKKAPKPKFSSIPTQPRAVVNSDEFKAYWTKKVDRLEDDFDRKLCVRVVEPAIRTIAMQIIRNYCESMEDLERYLADQEVITADYRIATMHAMLTAINVIQADLGGIDLNGFDVE